MSKETAKVTEEIPGKCPTAVEMGNSGWNILHGAAAVYPYKPTAEQRQAMQELIRGFSYFYPCNWCAYHMRTYLKAHPPDLSDKLAVSRFFCEFHNNVNEHLGKPQYDCDPANVLRRWHPGYPDKMEDRPSMEERIAAEQRRLQQEKEQEKMKQQPDTHSAPTSAAAKKEDKHNTTTTTTNGEAGASAEAKKDETPRATSWRAAPTAPKEVDHVMQTPPLPHTYVAKDIDTLGATASQALSSSRPSSWWSWWPRSQNKAAPFTQPQQQQQQHHEDKGKMAGQAAAAPQTPLTPSPAAVKASDEIQVHSRKVADSETNIELILRRLKGCHVYCPEDEEKLKK